MEHMRAELTNWIEQQQRKHERDVEMFRSVISSGRNALKACLLINGRRCYRIACLCRSSRRADEARDSCSTDRAAAHQVPRAF